MCVCTEVEFESYAIWPWTNSMMEAAACQASVAPLIASKKILYSLLIPVILVRQGKAASMVDGRPSERDGNIDIGEPAAKNWTDVWLIILAIFAGPTAYVLCSRVLSSISDLASTHFR